MKLISWENMKESGECFLTIMKTSFLEINFQSYLVCPHINALQFSSYYVIKIYIKCA